MFDDLMRELKRLEQGIKFSVPIEPDEEGYLDKECPSESCQFQFKVYSEDWEGFFSDEAVYCPFCGHKAKADSWATKDQIEHAEEQAVGYVEGLIGRSLQNTARSFNRSQPKSGFIRISMEVKGVRAARTIIPVPSSELLEQKIQCEKCAARLSVVGSAFFCPCCGFNSAIRTFDDALRKVRAKVDAVPFIKDSYRREGKRDEAELIARSLIETCLSDCVVGFQRIAEQIYEILPGGESAPMNVFQRIDDGSRLWKQAIGEGYEDWLTPCELTDLNILFQRRHLLAHTEGIVDQRYLNRSGDVSFKVNQRIVVREADVVRLAELVEKLVAGIKTKTGTS